MEKDSRGIAVRQGLLMRVEDALVEKVSCPEADSGGALLISYLMMDGDGKVSLQKTWLDVSQDTVILNRIGQRVYVCNVRIGAFVNAVFSAQMSKSMPPRADAFLILVQGRMQGRSMPGHTDITVDRIAYVDPEEQVIYIGAADDPDDQLRLLVNADTKILGPGGQELTLAELKPGQKVRVTHANFQTASIPPQTTAYRIQAE